MAAPPRRTSLEVTVASLLQSAAFGPPLANYVRFLELFRGTVSVRDGSIVIESDRRDYTMLLPLRPEAAPVLGTFDGSVLAIPNRPWLDEALARSELRKQTELIFMSKPAAIDLAAEGAVRIARTTQDVEDFSVVQSRGFLEEQTDFDEWYPWLRAANLRNQADDRCVFLLADRNGAPASVTLLLDAAEACGIYAVATPPDHRQHGLGTTLLKASESMAKRRGYDVVCLQVYAGTYARGFYERLGFVEDFRVGIWRAPRT